LGKAKIKLIQGDCLEVMKEIPYNSINLIYVDPPFGIGMDDSFENNNYNTTEWDTPNDIDDIFNLQRLNPGKRIVRLLRYLYPRLKMMRDLLTNDGSIYVHCDWRVNSHIRLLLDEVFNSSNYFSEIIWQRSTTVGSSKAIANRYPTLCDHILLYCKVKDENIFNKQYTPPSEDYKARFKNKDSQGYYYWNTLATYSEDTFNRLKGENKLRWSQGARYPQYKTYLHELKGNVLSNVWTDINMLNPMAVERLQYPTQKPEALLERIIKASSNEGDLVADFFCGSGTTAAVCKRLNRNFIGCDISERAIKIAKNRIHRRFIGTRKRTSKNNHPQRKTGFFNLI